VVFSERSPHVGSRDPARASPFGLPHPGGVLIGERARLRKFTRHLEHSRLRGRCPSPHSLVQREVNDETRSDRYRKPGLFGFNGLGGGGQCTSQYQPKLYPVTPGAQREPWEAGPGPMKRGAMCITHTDINRGYGFQGPCPAPKAAAAPKAKRRVSGQ
jgi:hypothetical protein